MPSYIEEHTDSANPYNNWNVLKILRVIVEETRGIKDVIDPSNPAELKGVEVKIQRDYMTTKYRPVLPTYLITELSETALKMFFILSNKLIKGHSYTADITMDELCNLLGIKERQFFNKKEELEEANCIAKRTTNSYFLNPYFAYYGNFASYIKSYSDAYIEDYKVGDEYKPSKVVKLGKLKLIKEKKGAAQATPL